MDTYRELIKAFLDRHMSALDFETQYLDMYLGDQTLHPDEEFAVLDRLFGDVDAFVADAELREAGDLDEEQLRERARVALEGLQAHAEGSGDR